MERLAWWSDCLPNFLSLFRPREKITGECQFPIHVLKD
ncbi:hypothetical protein IMCC12053_2890 [Celeribacter marinus]|uniref:Uncharacterized protein n=1 Tax=Celeribacter marinus TaxID=1397108 RepID=A0A0N7HJ25_9RHOB|nr:hypothetical protein IMCC12053_2890 [Celeribacter marinus]